MWGLYFIDGKVELLDYRQALEYIENTAKFGINLGLERMEKLLEFLGNPEQKIKSIHIAGTNGKGSAAAMIAAMLQENGYKVGMYTSPHLEVFEERMQINGENISRQNLALCVEKVSEAVSKVIKLGYDDPTEFEIETCAMFYYFCSMKVDFAVIEVGLGGRLDATNVMTPFDEERGGGVILSVIMSISYDHMHILGDTLGKIAFEKAGIIKEKVPVVLYPQTHEAENVIEDVCKKKNAPLFKVPCESAELLSQRKFDSSSSSYCQKVRMNVSCKSYDINLSLIGKHQMLNCAAAVFSLIKINDIGFNVNISKSFEALSHVKWKGRLEVLRKSPLVIIDGAHNIDGIEMLKYNVKKYFKYKHLILILGILADKQVSKMTSVITPAADRVICVTPNSVRSEDAFKLKKIAELYNKNCEAFQDYREAYARALYYAEDEDIVLVSGSLYMIGDMRKIINSK